MQPRRTQPPGNCFFNTDMSQNRLRDTDPLQATRKEIVGPSITISRSKPKPTVAEPNSFATLNFPSLLSLGLWARQTFACRLLPGRAIPELVPRQVQDTEPAAGQRLGHGYGECHSHLLDSNRMAVAQKSGTKIAPW